MIHVLPPLLFGQPSGSRSGAAAAAAVVGATADFYAHITDLLSYLLTHLLTTHSTYLTSPHIWSLSECTAWTSLAQPSLDMLYAYLH